MNLTTARRSRQGFTLLEVVVTIVVAAVLGTILVQFMGTSLRRSAQPVVMVERGLSLAGIMERMTSDYKRLLATESNPLALFKSYVETGNDDSTDPYYGEYSYDTEYIVFAADGTENTDSSGENRVLKVTIRAGDQDLTALFTR